MHTVEILKHFIENNQLLAYFVIFLGIILEGEIVVISTGVLSSLGAVSFWWSFVFIILGGMVKTIGCYYLGMILYKKYNQHNFFKYLERRVLYFMPRFSKKPFWSIFISKFIMGVNYLVLIFSGYLKINFKTYIKAEVFSTFIWAPALLSLGFFFSQIAFSYSKEISRFSLIVFLFLVVFLLFDKLMASIYRIFQFLKSNGIDNNEKK